VRSDVSHGALLFANQLRFCRLPFTRLEHGSRRLEKRTLIRSLSPFAIFMSTRPSS
jgi:hypothetical protein